VNLRRLAWRHLTGRPGSGAALVVTISVALCLPALPLVISAAAPARPTGQDLAQAGGVLVQQTGLTDSSQFDRFQAEIEHQLGAVAGAYLDAGAELAAGGAVRFDSVDGQPPPAGPAQANVVYASDLAAREQLVAGQLARPVENSLQGAVSMRADAASQLGLRLGDVSCLATAGQPVPAGAQGRTPGEWCARLVGLWRPLRPEDPYWAHIPAAALYTDREDFFAQLATLATPGGQVDRWYAVRPGVVTAADASDFKDALGRAARALSTGRSGSLQTDLGPALDRYAVIGRRVDFSVGTMAALLVAVAVLLVAARAAQFVEVRRADLAALLVRGWPVPRVRRLLRQELGLATGLAVLLVTALGLTATVVTAGRPLTMEVGAGWRGELLLAELATVIGSVAGLVVLTAAPLGERADQQAGLRPGTATMSQRLVYINGLLLVPAASLLLLPDRLAVQHWMSIAPLGAGGFVVFAVLLALLCAAATGLLPVAASGLAGLVPGPGGVLARLQLRTWGAGAWAGALLVLATATSGVAASWLAAVALGAVGSGDRAMNRDLVSSLAGGLVASALTALAAAWLLGRAGGRSGLPLHDLSTGALRLARNTELTLGIGLSVVAGACLGPGLAWAASARVSDDTLSVTVVALAVAAVATAVALLTGGLAAGRLAASRRL
jgi:hypothetical protein